MAPQHPIYDHLKRDAQGRVPRRPGVDADDALIPPVQAPAAGSYPAQTPPPIEPIAPRPGLLIRVLRKLKLSRTPKPHPEQVAPKTLSEKHTERLVAAAQRRWLRGDLSRRLSSRAGQSTQGRFVDVLTATPGEPKLPDEAFARLHWGGVFLYVGDNEKSVQNLAEAYDGKRGFILEEDVTPVHALTCGLRIPGLTPHGFAFLARKTQLIQPGDFTERFTYHVELTRCAKSPDAPDGYVVTKRVPTIDNLLGRLQHKFPDVSPDDLRKRWSTA